MHIAIDITPLESGHKDRGTGSYTGRLIEALQRYESEHSYSFFTRGQKIPKDSDLVHYPYFDPFFLTLPLLKPRPVVATVHDLIPLAYETHFSRGIRGNLKWYIQRASLRGVRKIITDSAFSKRDIRSITGIPNDAIDVVSLAPADVFQPISDRGVLAAVQKKYNLPQLYLLYVGDVNWNKNVLGLLRAYRQVRRQVSGVKLVLIGKAFRQQMLNEVREINVLIQSLDIERDIVRPGFIPDEDLAVLYNLASVYIQPSFTEGFGLPVLEAFACGCPVVCARGSSLDEIAGPSIRVNASDVDSIGKGILQIVKLSDRKRVELIQKQLTWVRQFSWKKTAFETAKVYEKIFEAARAY